MASSDDEDEMLLPQSVNNYHFVDEEEDPICFSVLPFMWEEGQSLDAGKKQVFLHGVSEDGLQKIYMQAIAWKVDLEGIRPEIYIYSKDEKWIMLLKPRKSFEDTIRNVLITIQCIHFLKRNQEATEKSLWDHVRKVFSHYEIRASQNDILDHIPFICKMIERDDTMAKSELLVKLSLEASQKNSVNEGIMNDKSSDFINDDENDLDRNAGNNNDESDDDGDCFDSVCAICDNGGELLCCEGKCLRSFHATIDVDHGSDCKTLGFTRAQIHAIQNFKCSNCRYEKHQCFACGKLGSSKLSGAEVFRCANATCGLFYHPKCVVKLLHKESDTEAAVQEKKIAAGQKFLCPVHKCIVCKQKEDKHDMELQFATCRRCPTSYHRKCLPREIAFEDSEDEEIEQRAWDGLIPNRILIYCMRHEIDEELGTPARNHIIFPEVSEKKKVHSILSSMPLKSSMKRKVEDMGREIKKVPKVGGGAINKIKGDATEPQVKKMKKNEIPKKLNLPSVENKFSDVDEIKMPIREKLKSSRKDMLETLRISSLTSVVKKPCTPLPAVDSETEKRVLGLVRKASISLATLDTFIMKKSKPSTHAYSGRHVDKSITLGKVEGSMEAVQTALQKVDEDNGAIDNAKDVCEPEIIYQIMRWRNKLGVYLSPFLHGMLYTSFGRHFTKVDKLNEIVDRLHWYVQTGDMIVDFCCGANDFSMLMKEKLEATGKKCQYKNYDVIPPRNDFNFVKKDWMKVRGAELSSGSKLIMGLNPPFGVKAALANKFIDKALEFKPKLLILIVPKETQRLDEKETKYDLIWEDEKQLAGKAFYLPGTVDVCDKQLEQWNVQPPSLYLWSRSDWTAQHMNIAKEQQHLANAGKEPALAENGIETKTIDNHIEEKYGRRIDATYMDDSSSLENMAHRSSGKAEAFSVTNNDSPSKYNSLLDTGLLRVDGKRKLNNQDIHQKGKEKSKVRNFETDEWKKSNQTEEVHKDRDAELSNMSNYLPEAFESQLETVGDFYRSPKSRIAMVQDASIHRKGVDNVENFHSSRQEAQLSSPLPRISIIGDSGYGRERSNERITGQTDSHSEPPHGVSDRIPGQDIIQLVRTYGQQDASNLPMSRYSVGRTNTGLAEVGSLVSSPYGFPDSAVRSTTIMDRYAPRLDEMNLGFMTTPLGSSPMGLYSTRLDEMNHGIPGSAIGLSAIDRYSSRLNEFSAIDRYTSRLNEPNHVGQPRLTPDPPFLGGRGSIYDTPDSWNSSLPRPFPHQRTREWRDGHS